MKTYVLMAYDDELLVPLHLRYAIVRHASAIRWICRAFACLGGETVNDAAQWQAIPQDVTGTIQ